MEDLETLNSIINDMNLMAGNLNDIHKRIRLMGEYEAIVKGHALFNSPEEKSHGKGAIQVTVPELSINEPIWIKPKRWNGKFKFPSLGSVVALTFRNGRITEPFYSYTYFVDTNDYLSKVKRVSSEEKIGFNSKLEKALSSPNTDLISSGDTYSIFASETDKEIKIEGDTGYKVSITAKGSGTINFGGESPSDLVDINLSTGSKVSLKIGNTTLEITPLKIEAKIGNSEITATSSKIKLKSTDIETEGDWKHKGKISATEDIASEMEVIAKSKSTPYKLTLSKTSTAIPGPPSPLTPA